MNWFSSLPQWFHMIIVGSVTGAIVYRLIRYGISLRFKAPGGAEGEIDADNSSLEQKTKPEGD